MSQPLVSIVVPAYERAGFVETAIMSLVEQDYPALEILAIDDGSLDETSAILARIAERSDSERFRWWQQENAGQAATINRGFGQARGELLGYLSSDDYLLPGAISRLVDALAANPEADVAYSDQLIVDDSDHVTDTIELTEHTFDKALRLGLCLIGVGALTRRRLYDRIGGWDPHYHFYPDYEWWLRAGEVGFVRVPEPGGAWRMHGGSISTGNFEVENVRERLRERFLILDAVYARGDLPASVRTTEQEAYSTMLIELGLMFDRDGSGRPDHRFVVEDRLGETYSHRAAEGFEKSLLWSERQRLYAEHRGTAAEYVNGQLQQTVDALRDTVAERERHVTQLEDVRRELTAEVERLHAEVADAAQARAELAAHESRPRWLRIARELTPRPLRDRDGRGPPPRPPKGPLVTRVLVIGGSGMLGSQARSGARAPLRDMGDGTRSCAHPRVGEDPRRLANGDGCAGRGAGKRRSRAGGERRDDGRKRRRDHQAARRRESGGPLDSRQRALSPRARGDVRRPGCAARPHLDRLRLLRRPRRLSRGRSAGRTRPLRPLEAARRGRSTRPTRSRCARRSSAVSCGARSVCSSGSSRSVAAVCAASRGRSSAASRPPSSPI